MKIKVAVMMALILTAESVKAEPFFEQVDVFTSGQDNVHTYRIPGVVVTNKGTILAFCEARKQSISDGSPTDVVLKRSFDNGKSWQPMQTLVEGIIHYLRLPEPDVKVEAIMDPTPLVDRSTGTIWLSCTQYLNRKMGKNYLLKSTDDGATWSKPIDIGPALDSAIDIQLKANMNHKGSFSAGPGMAIQLKYNKKHKGRLIFPGRGPCSGQTKWGCFSVYSDDHGQSWQKGQCTSVAGECQMIELIDGSVMLNIRSGRKKCRVLAVSKDAGLTWGEPYDEPQLPEYGCQASIIRYTDKFVNDRNRILFSNPNTIKRQRMNMTVRLSYDEGKTWLISKQIHPGPSSYSNLAIAQDGTILCFYEGGKQHRREWIRLARFNLDWLTDGKDRLNKINPELK